MNKSLLHLIVALFGAISLSTAHVWATTYNVGPGQSYTSLGAVPWYQLGAGDIVKIYYQATPYREIINISTRGTAASPIVIQGVPGPNGEQPILDGQNATVSANMRFAFPTGTPRRGVVVVGPQSGFTYGFKPGYIQLSGLTIRNGHPSYSFTNAAGTVQTFSSNAASIFVERGEHITVSNCTITGSGNGLFVASSGDEATQSRDILVQNNYIYGNGVSGSYYEHNVYTEAIGVVFQYNHFGNTTSGSQGSVLKDRSAGTVIRYNWIESGQSGRMLDLVDPQEGAAVEVADPTFHQTFVYGNVIYNGPQPQGSTGMIHYGGDDGVYRNYRKGTLYFYNNTVVIECNQTGTGSRWRTILLDVSTNDEVVDVRNNIIYVKSFTAGAMPTEFDFFNGAGTASFGGNWVSPGWNLSNSSGTFTGTATGINNFFVDPANNPSFVNLSTQDFRLAVNSNAIDKGGALSPIVTSNPAGQTYTVTNQYVKHQSFQARPVNGSSTDYGAFEASTGSTNSVDFYTNEAPPAVSFTSGLGNAVVAAEGVGGSNCVKFSGLTTWDKTKRIHYTTPKDITSVGSTDKLRISVDIAPGTPATNLAVHFNDRWDIYVWTPILDNAPGFQTFDIDISSVRSALGNTLNDVYFEAGAGFPSGVTLKVDDIKFVRVAGARQMSSDVPTLSEQTRTFPNPADAQLTVLLPESVSQATPLTLVNLTGKALLRDNVEAGYQSKTLITKEIAEGIYILRLETAQGLITRKIVIAH